MTSRAESGLCWTLRILVLLDCLFMALALPACTRERSDAETEASWMLATPLVCSNSGGGWLCNRLDPERGVVFCPDDDRQPCRRMSAQPAQPAQQSMKPAPDAGTAEEP